MTNPDDTDRVLVRSSEEAFAELRLAYPNIPSDDLERLILDCTPEEQTAILEEWRIAGIAPTAGFWDKMLQILLTCATVAGAMSGLSGAIQSVYGLKSL